MISWHSPMASRTRRSTRSPTRCNRTTSCSSSSPRARPRSPRASCSPTTTCCATRGRWPPPRDASGDRCSAPAVLPVARRTLSLLVSLSPAPAWCHARLHFDAGATLEMLADERCTLTSGNDTLFQLMMGHPSFDPRGSHLRGGWAAAGPETIRNIMEKMGARDLCVAYGLSEASPNVVLNDHRDPVELRIAGLAKPHDGVEVRITQRGTGAVLPRGRDRRDRGARLERDARLLQGPGSRPPRLSRPTAGCAPATSACSPRTAGCAWSAASRTSSASAARTSRRPRSRRSCSRIPRSRPAQVVGVPDARLGEVQARPSSR